MRSSALGRTFGTTNAKEATWPPAPAGTEPKEMDTMTSQVEAIDTTIPQGRTLRIQGGKGLELSVVAGCLWVAYEHDAEDTVLEPGETLRVSRNGRTLVHAPKEVQLRIAYPVEAGAPSLTPGGDYREFASSVARSMFVDWLRGIRGRIAPAAKPAHAA
jgi:hypothetical protein